MEKAQLDQYFKSAATVLGLETLGEIAYGWHFKSAGCKVADRNGAINWLRVIAFGPNEKNDRIWNGLKEAASIQGVKKPSWIKDYQWQEGQVKCRADLLEFIDVNCISKTPELTQTVPLNPGWFAELRQSLENLHRFSTSRVCVRQDLVARRLRERFGDTVDASVSEWETSHGDLHWANLTMPGCWILDWEGWGTAPKCTDVAFLYCFSLQNPDIASLVWTFFSDWLESVDGIKAQMFACSELMRMTELYSDHPNLYPKLYELAVRCASSFKLPVLKAN